MTHSRERFTQGPKVDAEGFAIAENPEKQDQVTSPATDTASHIGNGVVEVLSDAERHQIQEDACDASPSHAHVTAMGSDTRNGSYPI